METYNEGCLECNDNTDLGVCTEAINKIYSDGLNCPTYTEKHIKSAMDKLDAHEYSMPIPNFFKTIVSQDVKDGTNFSRKLACCFQIMDITYALIDKKVEKKEAQLIDQIQKRLTELCDANGVEPYSNDVNPMDYVEDGDSEKLFVTADRPGKEVNEQEKVTQKESKKPEKKVIDDNSNPIEELESLIGLSRTKEEVQEIVDFARVQKARKDKGLPVSSVSYHLVFTGRPGTGKTTVARLVAKIYKELGIVSKGEIVECSAKDLVAGYVGQTAIKTGEVIEKALGGVLFIDEAYTLVDKSGQGYGQEAIDTLLKEMEDHRDDFAVIVAGYDDLMKGFIESNPGLKSRFNRYVHFDDYTPDEMYEIFSKLCEKNAYELDEESVDILKKYFAKLCDANDDTFANARTVRNVFESIIAKQARRIAKKKNKTMELLSSITKEDVIECVGEEKDSETIEDVMKEFNALIGLETVKEEISDLVFIVQNQQRRKAQGLKVPSLSLHLVFMGNPGTGKTTVARLIARIYKCLGLLSKGQLIETDRSGLVAGYVGQTAIKTQEVINSALGGVLFIDEAYTLSNGGDNDFGQEAIDTLLKAMEDRRDDLVVIVAGYDDLMDEFVHSNPGLESRFNRYIHFRDYTAEQLLDIFEGLCKKNQYKLSEEAKKVLIDHLATVNVGEIGNGRGVRNIFEKVVTQQARRVETSDDSEIDFVCRTSGKSCEATNRWKTSLSQRNTSSWTRF